MLVGKNIQLCRGSFDHGKVTFCIFCFCVDISYIRTCLVLFLQNFNYGRTYTVA